MGGDIRKGGKKVGDYQVDIRLMNTLIFYPADKWNFVNELEL